MYRRIDSSDTILIDQITEQNKHYSLVTKSPIAISSTTLANFQLIAFTLRYTINILDVKYVKSFLFLQP